MGYNINDYEKCDVVVVNTCGFIGPAIGRIRMQAIGEALDYARKVIVTGCLEELVPN